MKKTVNIKVASDVVCPWCYIGKKELEKAMKALDAEYFFEIQYLPFELDPSMPVQGANFKTYITNKFGNYERFLANTQVLTQRGKGLGIEYRFEDIVNTPNTFQIHRIIQFANQSGIQANVKEAFMSAYFEKNIDLTQQENIVAIAAEAGLDAEHVTQLLSSNEGSKEIKNMQDQLRAMGISGVPFFIINDQYGLSGAVPYTDLIEAIRGASAEEQTS
jgi:predicted DsbA family dithiol-disulfide isomerase